MQHVMAAWMPCMLLVVNELEGLAPLDWLVWMKMFFIFLGLYSPIPNLSEFGIQELAPWFPRLLALQWACLSALLYKSFQRLAARLWCHKRIVWRGSFQKRGEKNLWIGHWRLLADFTCPITLSAPNGINRDAECRGAWFGKNTLCRRSEERRVGKECRL